MAHRIIPVVVDQTSTFDPNKRFWKLGLFNPDGSLFEGNPGDMFGFGDFASIPSASSVPDKYIYFAEDVEGGKLYQSQGDLWVELAPGVLAAPRGLIGSSRIGTSIPTTAIDTSGFDDLPGVTVSVDVEDRPIRFSARLPFSQVSLANMQLQFALRDSANDKVLWWESLGSTTPNVAPSGGWSAFFTVMFESPPTLVYTDGVAIPSGTRTFKMSITAQAGSGNYRTTWVAGSSFVGQIDAYEV